MKWLLSVVGALAIACATAPRPTVLGQVDAVREGGAAKEAAALAPQAHAHAEKLRLAAAKALDDGDRAGAQILGEHALAAYSHAFVLARLVKAEKRLAEARKKLADAKKELGSVDEQHRRVASEADAIELKIKVARDAIPLVPNAPTSPEREKARREAALALTTQARLLCVATQLLAPKTKGLDGDLGKLDALAKTLAKKPEATPIDEAIALRSSCLKRLTLARRPAAQAAPAAGGADRLLSELSRASLTPSRDDRGIVVTLRGLSRGALSKEAEQALGALGRTAKANPTFPVMVVVHVANAKTSTSVGEAVRRALTDAGAKNVNVQSAGKTQPVVDPKRRGAAARNERIEIVFVAPAS